QVNDRAMFDAVAMVWPRGGFQRLFVAIEEQADSCITDGVGTTLESGHVGLPELALEFFRLLHPEANVVCFSLVRLRHPGRATADRAIEKEFGRTNAQPLVAESGRDTQFDQ